MIGRIFVQKRYIHLKCSTAKEQIADRLQYHPQIVELQLFEADIENPIRIYRAIRELKSSGVTVYLHHPMKVKGKFLDLLSPDPEVTEFYHSSNQILDDICTNENIYCVVHPHYEKFRNGKVDPSFPNITLEQTLQLSEAIQSLRRTTRDRFLWENTPRGIFSNGNPNWFTHLVQPQKLPICYDISHAFMSFHGDNNKLVADIHQTLPYIRYFHVVDSKGTAEHDALPLGTGNIDWVRIKEFIVQRDFIFEIDLPDYNDGRLMVDSAEFFASL